ncbi:MAG: RsbRD N-terminal domain-containing protein [Anaerolineae bacterium]|nr:RsbRD N-terminal domain-containing protein [Anaerolineae bacterium]
MANPKETVLRLDTLLRCRAEEIARDWMERILAEPTSPYRDLPREELHASTMAILRGIAWAVGPEGKCDPLREHLATLTVTRLTLGFPIGAIVQALLLGKEVIAPYLLEAYEHDQATLRESMAKLDECLRKATLYFADRYAAEMDRRLREEQEQVVQKARQVATLEERQRLAREIHDQLAQAVGYMHLQVAAVADLLDAGQVEEARTTLEALKRYARGTYVDVRESIFNLRVHGLSQQGFLPTLRQYLAEYQDHYGIAVTLEAEAESLGDVPLAVATQAIRIIQEALSNVRKHAQTQAARVRVARSEECMHVVVEDQGIGLDPERQKASGHFFGLQTMRERAAAIGGTLEVQSAPGRGTRVVLRVPCLGEAEG